jgi:hypothetical protein
VTSTEETLTGQVMGIHPQGLLEQSKKKIKANLRSNDRCTPTEELDA